MSKHYFQNLRTLFNCCLSKTGAIHIPLETVPPEPVLCDNVTSEEISESEIETIILPKTEIIVPDTIEVETRKGITDEHDSDSDNDSENEKDNSDKYNEYESELEFE